MPSFISCGQAVIDVSIGASTMHREYCAERMEAYRRPDCRASALLDTGADAMIVDLEILEDLCLSSHDSRKVEAFNGTFDDYPVYVVSLKL